MCYIVQFRPMILHRIMPYSYLSVFNFKLHPTAQYYHYSPLCGLAGLLLAPATQRQGETLLNLLAQVGRVRKDRLRSTKILLAEEKAILLSYLLFLDAVGQ